MTHFRSLWNKGDNPLQQNAAFWWASKLEETRGNPHLRRVTAVVVPHMGGAKDVTVAWVHPQTKPIARYVQNANNPRAFVGFAVKMGSHGKWVTKLFEIRMETMIFWRLALMVKPCNPPYWMWQRWRSPWESSQKTSSSKSCSWYRTFR